MNDVTARQPDWMETSLGNAIVIGAGGVGTWVAFGLAMTHAAESIIIMDGDVVENHNRGRLPYTEEDVGNNKAEVLRDWLKRLRPGLPIISVDEYLRQETTIDVAYDSVFFCGEGEQANLAAAEVFNQAIEGNRFVCLSADGDEFVIRDDTVRMHMGEDEGYTEIWVGTAMTAAMAGIRLLSESFAGGPTREIRPGIPENMQSGFYDLLPSPEEDLTREEILDRLKMSNQYMLYMLGTLEEYRARLEYARRAIEDENPDVLAQCILAPSNSMENPLSSTERYEEALEDMDQDEITTLMELERFTDEETGAGMENLAIGLAPFGSLERFEQWEDILMEAAEEYEEDDVNRSTFEQAIDTANDTAEWTGTIETFTGQQG